MKTQKILAVLLIFTFWFGTTGFMPGQSNGSQLLAQNTATVSSAATAAETTFSRLAPKNGEYGVPTIGAVISWESLGSNYTYQYCLWPRQKKACPPGQWKNAGSGTSFTLPTLTANSTYYWQLRAKSGNTYIEADNGAWWSFHTAFNIPSAFSKLSPANNLTTLQPLSLTLSWSTSTGDSIHYEYCYTSALVGGLCAGPWYRSDTTSALISGLSYDTTYYWQVRAVNISGTTDADSGVIWQFRTQKAPPVPFFKLSPTSGSLNEPINPTLDWSPSTGATAYYYCYDTTDDNSCAGNWTSNGTDTSVVLSGLSYATTYYWQVYSVNAQGQVLADSGTWWSFATIGAAPAAFNKINPTNGSTNQSLTPKLYWWSPEQGTDGTEFSYCLNTVASCPDGGWTAIDLNTPIAISTALAYNTTYYWQVKAENNVSTTFADGATGWWSFTTHLAPPTSSNQSFNVAEDTTLEDTLSASSGYQNLTFTLVGGLPAGQFHLNSDGSFTYTPEANFNGQATFQFLVSDGYNLPAGPYTATINVTSVQDTPVIDSIPTQFVNAGDLLVFLATATDGDTPYGDTLVFSLTAPDPLPAGAQISANGVFTWAVPDSIAPGVYSFTVKVTDSTGRSDTTDVDVVVAAGIPVTGGSTIFLPLVVH